MRLTCPNCTAQYEVPADVIPASGRDVQCSNCSHTWFQQPFDDTVSPSAAAMIDEFVVDDNDAAPDAATQSDADDFETELDKVLEHELAPDDGSDASLGQASMPNRPKRRLDSSVASVLREEAEREKRARAADPVETQIDLGLDNAPQPAPSTTRTKSGYMGPDLGDLDDLYQEGGKNPESHRRDLLPDIEEINSTLRNDHGQSGANRDANASAQRKNNSRSGFLFALIVLAAAVWVYLYADLISEHVPSVSDALNTYVAWVDTMRAMLNQWASAAMTWLEDQANAARGS